MTINFDALGYETAYYAINMGSCLIIYMLMPVFLIVVYITYFLSPWCPKIRAKMKHLVDEFFFTAIIESIEEMYTIVIICIFVNFNQNTKTGVVYDFN